jgi:hypothetical protein
MSPQRFRMSFFALAGLAALSAGAADARTCQIPRALLCEGCADQLTITLARNGRCIVSFSPLSSPSTSATDGRLTVRIIVAPRIHTARRRSLRRHFAQPTVAIAPAGPRCFIFNERRYCE